MATVACVFADENAVDDANVNAALVLSREKNKFHHLKKGVVDFKRDYWVWMGGKYTFKFVSRTLNTMVLILLSCPV